MIPCVTDNLNISPRNALVTGGNSALAEAITTELLADPAERWHVWLGVRSRRERAEGLVARDAQRVHLIDLDVTDSEAWKRAVDQVIETAGRVDALVSNAGIHRDALLATMDEADWHAVIDSNLNGAFLGCRAVIVPMMRQRFGRIVNIASLSALLAPKGQANYAAAKAGMIAMSRSVAKETARAGITVNCVCPGYIDTPALDSIPLDQRKILMRDIPMRRFGRPEEIACAVRFLVSSQASYITGAVLKIDGGIF